MLPLFIDVFGIVVDVESSPVVEDEPSDVPLVDEPSVDMLPDDALVSDTAVVSPVIDVPVDAVGSVVIDVPVDAVGSVVDPVAVTLPDPSVAVAVPVADSPVVGKAVVPVIASEVDVGFVEVPGVVVAVMVDTG